MSNILYTIGYCCFRPENFRDLLLENQIGALVDVRANPHSTTFPEYNIENLSGYLKRSGIHYLHFGEEFGARPRDSALYSNDRVDYSKLARSRNFETGMERLRNGVEKFSVCLMCAQKDPANCHRSILITRIFAGKYPEIPILHFWPDAKMETQRDMENRLLKHYKLNQEDLLKTAEQRLDEAYFKREQEIAWKQ